MQVDLAVSNFEDYEHHFSDPSRLCMPCASKLVDMFSLMPEFIFG
jgi:hypothetical protein